MGSGAEGITSMENSAIETLASQVAEQYRNEQAAKERLHQFFDLLDDLLCIANRNGIFEWVNKAWTRELGWTFEELTSEPWLDFVHPDDVPATIDAAARMEIGSIKNFSNRYITKSGEYRRLNWTTLKWNGGGYAICIARIID